MSKLRVFDIQRFALHDGPGVRTTVFLKGCPLDCVWCHNPESKKPSPQLSCLFKNCVSCGRCVRVCPNEVHSIAGDGTHSIEFDRCKLCGECVKACFQQALRIYGYSMSVEDVLKTVLRDKDFYDRSGGGLTVSGGEAMLQFEAVYELFRLAKGAGLHTCLDTSGFASTEHYRLLLPYTDVILYDYKLTDPNAHRQYTGVDNSLIRNNLDFLCSNGAQVYLRCPIIPGINDNNEHYAAIAVLSQKYSAITEVNLMTYHDMGKGKARQIGVEYGLDGLKTVEKKEKEAIYARVREFGCLNLKES